MPLRVDASWSATRGVTLTTAAAKSVSRPKAPDVEGFEKWVTARQTFADSFLANGLTLVQRGHTWAVRSPAKYGTLLERFARDATPEETEAAGGPRVEEEPAPAEASVETFEVHTDRPVEIKVEPAPMTPKRGPGRSRKSGAPPKRRHQ